MNVNHCGIHFTHRNFKIHRPGGSGDYLFVYTKTPAVFTVENKDVYVPSNTVFLYQKGGAQYFRGAEEIYINDYIHFNTDTDEEERWMAELGLIYHTPLQLPNARSFMSIQQQIVSEVKSHSPLSKDATDALLRCFLIRLTQAMSLSQSGSDVRHLEPMNELRRQIYEDPSRAWTVEAMAKAVRFSPSYFQKLYKNIFNTACMTDVIYARIEKAKELLMQTALTAREISALCGYQNETHFSRQFKQFTGTAPQEYRKRYP